MNITKAMWSPCLVCDNFGNNDYPECNQSCLEVNKFLKLIGDLPHRQPEKDLYKLFPPNAKEQTKDLCTKEEYAVVAKFVKKYQKTTGFTGKQIAKEIGCIPEMINSITRDNQQAMTKRKYQLFVAWMEGKEGD
jgi:hypothetical protein